MKRCFKCLCLKPLAEFYKHVRMKDGHLNKCILCAIADEKKRRLERLEYVRAYDRRRASQPHRLAASVQQNKQYRAAHPDRARANAAVARALRKGSLQRWPCEVCGNERTVAHHPHYSSPLLVTWLCQPHHKQAHALV